MQYCRFQTEDGPQHGVLELRHEEMCGSRERLEAYEALVHL